MRRVDSVTAPARAMTEAEGRSSEFDGTAAVFPGQGSQTGAMGAAWREHGAWGLVERAEEVLGRPLGPLLLDTGRGPVGTVETQLAVFLTSMMAWSAFLAEAGPPAVAAGHSLGQITALAAAGVLDFDDAVRLVDYRGQASDRVCAQRPGGMVAVLGLDSAGAAAACAAAPGRCWLANDNAPGQVVYSGTPDGLDRTLARARDLGGRRFFPLAVAGAFHTPLMAAAAEELTGFARTLRFAPARFPVVLNADARPAAPDRAWAVTLGRHLVQPVRWRETQLLLERRGARALVEIGVGGTLAGLARRTIPHVQTAVVDCPRTAAVTGV